MNETPMMFSGLEAQGEINRMEEMFGGPERIYRAVERARVLPNEDLSRGRGREAWSCRTKTRAGARVGSHNNVDAILLRRGVGDVTSGYSSQASITPIVRLDN